MNKLKLLILKIIKPSPLEICAAQFANDELSARRIGVSIINNAHWFSEDMSAVNALTAVGEALRDNGVYGVSSARDNWRRMNEMTNK